MKFCAIYSLILLTAGIVGGEVPDVLIFLALAWGSAFVYNLDRST